MKRSSATSFVSALLLGALSLNLAACGSEKPGAQDETSSSSGALNRAAVSSGDESPTAPSSGAARASGVLPPLGAGGPRIVFDPCLPAPEVVSFAATPATIDSGASADLDWDVRVPDGCNYMLILDGQEVALHGKLPVQPLSDTTYKLTLSWGPSRTLWTSATTAVSVNLPADPADPTRKLVTITTPLSLPLFVQALRTSNTTVMVDNSVDLDLSNLENILIAAGVHLIGGRAATPGRPFQPGPRLYTTTKPSVLFDIEGPGVRLTGLRVQGHLSVDPPGIADEDDDSSIGISIGFSSRGPIPVQIDHDEIYGWSSAGVQVLGADSVQDPAVASSFDAVTGAIVYAATPEPAYIHDNYIHNNLHSGKLGYGVVMGAKGAHALIERNVFDWNRHAISGDGSDLSGYRAYRNLVLANGGNDTWIPFLGVWHYTHQFDMHGQSSYCLEGFADRDCGTAGHDIDIQLNSFLYTAGTAIKVRGTPQLKPFGAVIKSNVFAHDSIGDAVDWTENGVLLGDDNQVGVTWTGIDSCDFDGDGIPDRFLTTGQTWWFSSNRGQGPWVYLNASTLRLGDVTLGYFDGDALCDVAAAGIIYSGGTAVPNRLVPRPVAAGGIRLGQ